MTERAVPVWSLAFLKAYLVTMRPYLLFVSGATALAGLSFVPDASVARLLLGFVPLFLSYGLGQALTDCFQTDTDAISAPYRPLVAGLISKRQVFWVSISGLTAVVAVLVYLNPMILSLGVLAVVGLLTYTFFKRRWWGGPPWNAWIVALIPIMGRLTDRSYSLSSLTHPTGPSDSAFVVTVLAILFGYMNFVVMGYFKDISADRETGYRTFPVVFGWTAAAVYGDVVALAALLCAARALGLLRAGLLSVIVLAVAAALYVGAQVAVHRMRDERATGGPIANGVRALVLLCISIAVGNDPSWLPYVAAFYVLFEVVLRLRPERGQV